VIAWEDTNSPTTTTTTTTTIVDDDEEQLKRRFRRVLLKDHRWNYPWLIFDQQLLCWIDNENNHLQSDEIRMARMFTPDA